MPHGRRYKDPARGFAWPPTRQDLELIEIVDANTLRPISLQCDAPEDADTDTVGVTEGCDGVAMTEAAAAANAAANEAVGRNGAVAPEAVAWELLQPVTPVLRDRARTYAIDTVRSVPPPAPTLPVIARRPARTWRIDTNFVMATGGVLAIALSAYLSLWEPRASVVEEPMVATSQEGTGGRLAAAPFPGVEMTGWPPAPVVPSSRSLEPPGSYVSPAVFQRPRNARPAESRQRGMTAMTSGDATVASKSAGRNATPVSNATLGSKSAGRNATRVSNETLGSKSAARDATPVGNAAPADRSARRDATVASRAAPRDKTLHWHWPSSQSAPGQSAPRQSTPSSVGPVVTMAAASTSRDATQPVSQPALLNPARTFPVASAAASLSARPVGLGDEPTARLRVAGTAGSAPDVALAAQTVQPRQQIVATLHRYERAYEQLDANAVRAVWPSVDTRSLARAFHDLKSQTLVFDQCDVDVAHVQAVAACRGRATYETRAGQFSSRTERREWTFTLQKHDDAWQIVSASAR